MRVHRAYGELAIPFPASAMRAIAAAESLVAARFEPVIRNGKGCGVVDLIFRRDAQTAVIPLIVVDVAMLEARERDPLVWPQAVADYRIPDAGISVRVEDWLAELLSAGKLNEESWTIFGDGGDEARFLHARERGFLGASPLTEVTRRAAPYVFARRHARGRDVAIATHDAALGATLLASVARRVRIASGDPDGIAWYAPEAGDCDDDVAIVEGGQAPGGAQVVIDLSDGGTVHIEPSPPVPMDQLFDFTGAVRRAERRFSVTTRRRRRPNDVVCVKSPPIGGSTGRILFVLRRGARRFGGADVDYADTLAAAMREEGFTVGVTEDPHEIGTFAPDLIHVFGLADAGVAAAAQRTAATMGVPFALHPLYDACGLGGYWGATVTPYCYRFMQDESMTITMLQLLAQRRLAVNDIRADAPFHPTNPRWESDVRAAISGADVVFATGAEELAVVRQFGIEGETVLTVPPIPPAGDAAAVDELVGSEPYAFMHAPIESTQNQLQAVRAAALADIPLVVAGPIADPDYAALVRSFGGERAVIVGEPDVSTLEGLYRGARVFLDVAWVGCGLARAARAVSRGAALAISSRLPAADMELGAFVEPVDPATVETIARGLGDAWYRCQEETGALEAARADFAVRADVREVTRRVVGGYAKALERRKSPALR